MDPDGALALLAEAELSERLSTDPQVEKLAVLGPFNPDRLGGTGEDGPDRDAAAILSLLCRRLPSGGAPQLVILTERVRIDALTRVLLRGGRDELMSVRSSAGGTTNSPLQRMLDAFVIGPGAPVESQDQDELLASLEVWRWMTEAVARAGLTAKIPVEPRKDVIEGRLALLQVTSAVRRLAELGCIGRADELRKLHAHVQSLPTSMSLANDPALVVYGIGGVGKSTLMARFVTDLFEEGQQGYRRPWAYLDLDRPTLASCAAEVVLADIAEQVAAQFPEQRGRFLRTADYNRRRFKGSGIESYEAASPYLSLAVDFASDLRSAVGGSLVVVLDTYEELERAHPEKADELFDMFAVMADQLPEFKLIVSGRAPASRYIDTRHPDRLLHVLPLTDTPALQLLQHYVRLEARVAKLPEPAVDDTLGAEVIDLVGGIPLTVRLAARVLVQEGAESIVDAAKRARALDRVRSEFVRGFLYHRILAHVTAQEGIGEPELRSFARASIVLRRLTVELIDHVLRPSIEPAPATPATTVFRALQVEVAFAENSGDMLRLRDELRQPALVALRIDDPALVRRVHEAAATFYANRLSGAGPTGGVVLDADRETAGVELAYHQLALGRSLVGLDPATLRLLGDQSDLDIPHTVASEFQHTLSDPTKLAASRALYEWERRVLPEAEAALRAGELARTAALLGERSGWSAGTELYRIQCRLEQSRGDLPAAVAAAGRDLDASLAAANVLRFAAAAVRLAGLHELMQAPDKADDTLRNAERAGLLVGERELRLELTLNRIAARERLGLGDDDSRWKLDLQARALLQRSDAQAIETNTALTRLLAVAFGKVERNRILAAVRILGLGLTAGPQRTNALLSALADWDSGGAQPGSLARRLNFPVAGADADSIRRSWAALARRVPESAALLDRLLSDNPPPDAVWEALRQIYLYWGVEPARPKGPNEPKTQPIGAPSSAQTFGSSTPIPDEPDSQEAQLEEILRTAYPTTTDARRLTALAGIDAGRISWTSTVGSVWNQIVRLAIRSDVVGEMITAVLNDPSAAALHGSLRDLVGDDWLENHGFEVWDLPWAHSFEVSTPYSRPGEVSDEAIWLAQSGRAEFRLHSTVTYVGVTGLESAGLSFETLKYIRTVTPESLGSTDLASVPGPLRWFVNTYGAHTPAALIHDRLIGDSFRPAEMTDVLADRYFRFMLESVGVSWLRRWMMWAAVAFRTRWTSSFFVKLSLVLWVVLAIAGMSCAVSAVVLWSWPLAAVAAGLPFVASVLWGRQYGAGLVAALAAPWLLPPSVLAVLGYWVYRELESLTKHIGRTAPGPTLIFRLDPQVRPEAERTDLSPN
jgi:hypothetical protein